MLYLIHQDFLGFSPSYEQRQLFQQGKQMEYIDVSCEHTTNIHYICYRVVINVHGCVLICNATWHK